MGTDDVGLDTTDRVLVRAAIQIVEGTNPPHCKFWTAPWLSEWERGQIIGTSWKVCEIV